MRSAKHRQADVVSMEQYQTHLVLFDIDFKSEDVAQVGSVGPNSSTSRLGRILKKSFSLQGRRGATDCRTPRQGPSGGTSPLPGGQLYGQ
jgi:hypothetical protein